MVRLIKVEGYEAFKKTIADLESDQKPLFVLFSGSKDPATGESWCPDCVAAEPVIEEALKQVPAETIFLYVGVGDRAFWKDTNCIFRTDNQVKLTCVPTLLKWGTNQRLLDNQCNNLDTVLMMFED